jgi:hypothetical protein
MRRIFVLCFAAVSFGCTDDVSSRAAGQPDSPFAPSFDVTGVADYYSIGSAVFLLLDEEAIVKGSPPRGFTAPYFTDEDVNESSATIGQRAPLAWFAANPGAVLDLPSGQVGDEGWFAMTYVPSSWALAGPTADGLLNLLQPGPGLGSGKDREALLDKIPGVTPLRSDALATLVGRTACAIVWKSDISINYKPLNGSLKGDNRGIVAFEVIAVSPYGSGSTLPRVTVRVLDAGGVCSDANPGDAL